ncbi:hypothetical protein ACIP80_33030 [Streptomyces sp. NPDC088555]|uniref:hypothetical protein n=1 Tax=Streptomyces sp. NPDC088555 TaxID=3365866 RepID=UPI00381BABF0
MNTLDTDTLTRFHDQHGDPTTWSAAEYDSYTVLGELAPPVPPLYSYAEMQTIAADYEQSSVCQQATADRLTAEGHLVAAGIWRRGARASREYAAAARRGYPHYEAVVNGW